ncbi:hypothetical protein SLOPH_237, partial [Spraguea lophii 42_110]
NIIKNILLLIFTYDHNKNNYILNIINKLKKELIYLIEIKFLKEYQIPINQHYKNKDKDIKMNEEKEDINTIDYNANNINNINNNVSNIDINNDLKVNDINNDLKGNNINNDHNINNHHKVNNTKIDYKNNINNTNDNYDIPLLFLYEAGTNSMNEFVNTTYNNILIDNNPDHDNILDSISLTVPNNYIFHSTFVCPVLRKCCSTDNPPILLECSHVISKEALNCIIDKNIENSGRIVKCPYCPMECKRKNCIEIYL